MSKIKLDFPPAVKVTGALYSRSRVHDLSEDMLQLELPGNLVIDVGWYPQWDRNGSYVILVFQDTVDHVLEKIRTRDYRIVVKQVQALLDKYLPLARGDGKKIRTAG